MFPLVSCFAIVVFCLFVVYEWIYWIVGGDLSDHAPASRVKKNASRHRTDILTESWVFAGVPQTSRQMPRNLRDLRKRLGKCRETCAACANVSANAAELARLAQTSRQMPRNLRDLRKRLGKCRGTCAACANVSTWGERSFRCRGVTLTPYRRPAGPNACLPCSNCGGCICMVCTWSTR